MAKGCFGLASDIWPVLVRILSYDLELSFTAYGHSEVLMTSLQYICLGTLPLQLAAILLCLLRFSAMLRELLIRVNKAEL